MKTPTLNQLEKAVTIRREMMTLEKQLDRWRRIANWLKWMSWMFAAADTQNPGLRKAFEREAKKYGASALRRRSAPARK
jgi:hypothetical protein